MSGLIPKVFIDELLARTDIIDIIKENIHLKKAGKNYQACCPFHKEKTPSFTVNQEKQFYYCFGCGEAGNAISFVMNLNHLDFPDAVEQLAQRLGLDVPREKGQNISQHIQVLKPLYELSEKATVFYQQQLTQHKESSLARKYLDKRGLNKEITELFCLGYAPSGWSNLLNYCCHDVNQKQSEIKENLENSGLVVRHETKGTVYDRFRKRIIFPIRDTKGRTIGFGGRALGDEKPKYINSPETPLFHKGRELYGLYEAKLTGNSLNQLIVVEGYMDVIALAQHNITNAVATLGTATTVDHIKKLFQHTKEIIFCFDGDDAGRQAAWRALEASLPVMEDGRKVRFLLLNQGEDPDTIVFKYGAQHFLGLIKEKGETLDAYLLEQIASSVTMHTLDGKAQFTRRAQHYIQQLPPGAYQQLLINDVAKRTELGNNIITDLMEGNHFVSSQTRKVQSSQGFLPPAEKREGLQASVGRSSAQKIIITPVRRALRILIKFPFLAEKISLDILEDDHDCDHDTKMLMTFIHFLQGNTLTSRSAIKGSWHNTALGELLTEVLLLDIPEDNPERMLSDDLELICNKLIRKRKSARSGREKLKDFSRNAVKRNSE